jgi:REP element-mobilizing transposase RayT
VIEAWKDSLNEGTQGKRAQAELLRKIAAFEDAGLGDCLLGNEECGKIVQNQLTAGHGDQYKLIEWCVMPNHAHVLIGMSLGSSLGPIVQRWKGASAMKINRLLGRSGPLWMKDYFDRFIRDEDHFYNARVYIRENPVKAGLCKIAEDWAVSSAGVGWRV